MLITPPPSPRVLQVANTCAGQAASANNSGTQTHTHTHSQEYFVIAKIRDICMHMIDLRHTHTRKHTHAHTHTHSHTHTNTRAHTSKYGHQRTQHKSTHIRSHYKHGPTSTHRYGGVSESKSS